ncbi:hypothetical protein GIB67_013250 [Kingdonia uniflora]|uniref:RBR-type E3 ubiquitin transferase n=1 Tax=Kingdonia uniflora TaxID=39325 RepID=A0A7J7NSU2_9MAGN|nr:hypothetical protein GIB67_013250 [Kingdonia uniflora]
MAHELTVDDFYFSVLSEEDEIFPISDEKYAEELQLQEALMSSVIASQITNGFSRKISVNSEPSIEYPETSSNGSLRNKSAVYNMCAGKSSQSFCEICMEEKQREDMFLNNKKCCHSYCTDCMSKHVAAKIQENINSVNCPGLNCKVVLEPEFCRSIVPEQVFDRWVNALCESMILGSQKVYCPFKDCSAMLIDDGVEVVTMSECPYCRRLFCAQCKVPWHSGLVCIEFKRGIGNDDLLVMEMAKCKNWKRCSNCKFYVEKKEVSFNLLHCRCGFQFCYGCGARWSNNHSNCKAA